MHMRSALTLLLLLASPGVASGWMVPGGPEARESPVAVSDPPATVLSAEVMIPADAPGRLGRGGMVSYPSRWSGKVHVKQRGRIRFLYLGRRLDIVHTRLHLDQPNLLISPYQRCLLSSFALLERSGQEIRRVAMIGLGGGALTRFFFDKRPGWVFHSVDIDPVVVAVARAFFGVRDTPRYRSYAMDGRRFLEEARTPYDLILLDAFNADAALPKVLASQEFFKMVRTRLTPRGLLVVNFLVHQPKVYASLVKTLSSVFPWVLRMPLGQFASRNTLLFTSANPAPVDRTRLKAAAGQVEQNFGVQFKLDKCIAAIDSDRPSLKRAPLIRDPPGQGRSP